MFFGVLIVLSISSIQSKVILEINDKEAQLSNEIHNDLRGQDTNATENIVKTIIESDGKISTSDKELNPNVHLPNDAINSIDTDLESDNNKTSCEIDKFNNDTVINEPIENKKIENGTALILTPYIENGNLIEARNMCEVESDIFLGLKSYSGFLTVNKTYNSNLFFWYWPIENKPVGENPWVIWLQGGPGASSMTGLFEEIGPFFVRQNLPLHRNPYSWLRNHSLIFIDNPVGSGYSFTDHPNGFAKDMATYSLHLKLAVLQLLELFPELKVAPLYVAGESYAGKYAPALAMELHKSKKDGLQVNLQGIITGNGFVEASMVTNITEAFHHFGLISKEDVTKIQPIMDAFADDVANNRSVAAKDKWGTVIVILLFMSGQTQAYNFLRDDIKFGQYQWLLDRSEVKRAIHVGDIESSYVNLTVNFMLAGEFLTSAKPLYEELLNHYKVLAYCGQLDQMLPCFLESEQYRKWKWNGTEEFHRAPRSLYKFMNRRAGYLKSGGNLTEVQIRGAGHMVPMDNPAPLQELVSRWTTSQPLSLHQAIIQGFFRNITGNVFL